MVPLNEKEFVIDLVPVFDAEIILVADLYLGSINHTHLTIHLLQERGYPVKGIIFNGKTNPESEDIIMKHCDYKVLLNISKETQITTDLILQYAHELLKNW